MIIGAVGGGGLGSELVGSLSGLEYHRVTTQVLALVLVIVVFDKATVWLRRHPRMIWALLPLGLACVAHFAPQLMFKLHNLEAFGAMFPPRLNLSQLHGLPLLVVQTILMAVTGTGLAVLIAIPLGAASGAAALALHSAGCLGKLFAEFLENVPVAPVAAITATGARPGAVFAYATAPLAFGPVAAHALFRLDWNLRMATVVGMIGGGGIGQALYNAQQLFFYRTMMAYLLVTWLLVMAFDALNTRLRRSYGFEGGATACEEGHCSIGPC